MVLPQTAGVALFLDGDFGRELMAGIGVNPFVLDRTPAAEKVRIDIDASDNLAFVLKRTLRFLHECYEIFPQFRELIGVFEDGEQGRIIFLPAPRQADRNKLGIELNHEVS